MAEAIPPRRLALRKFHFTPPSKLPGKSLGGKIIEQLKANLQTASTKSKPVAERAIAICWIFHLIGDLHQPLHVAAILRPGDPDGDRGGNQFFVRPSEKAAPNKLHALWDTSGVRKLTDFAGVQDNAAMLKSKHPVNTLTQLTRIKATDFAAIAKDETFTLAVKAAYLSGQLEGGDEHDGEDDPENVPVLPKDYMTMAGRYASQQIAIAGYRLAMVLREVTK